jgi:hypothetical protein
MHLFGLASRELSRAASITFKVKEKLGMGFGETIDRDHRNPRAERSLHGLIISMLLGAIPNADRVLITE